MNVLFDIVSTKSVCLYKLLSVALVIYRGLKVGRRFGSFPSALLSGSGTRRGSLAPGAAASVASRATASSAAGGANRDRS